MANMITGQVLSLSATEEITTRTGSKMPRRTMTLATRRYDTITGEPTTDFQNTPEMTFMGKSCAELSGVAVGDIVAVSFDVTGRKYTDAQGRQRIITDLRPYRLEIRESSTAAQLSPEPVQAQPQQQQPPGLEEDMDPLPF